MRIFIHLAQASLLFGVGGLFVICGGWAWLLSKFFKIPTARIAANPVTSLDLLIPAHNESSALKTLIPQIKEEGLLAKTGFPECVFKISVGADACSDDTETVARELGAEVRVFSDHRSKWKTLFELSASSSAEWVGWVDAEASWPKGFLSEVLVKIHEDGNRLGISPAFGPNPIWRIEEKIKLLENHLGGPISVHGATVFYRREELMEALHALQHTSWLNDDIVVPLMMRTQNPSSRLFYFTPQAGRVTENEREGLSEGRFRAILGQRSRMAAGNLQWISLLWIKVLRISLPVGFLALRRVLRPFWMYFVLALEFGFLVLERRNPGLALAPLFGPTLLALAYPEQVLPPVLASLWLPFRLRSVRRGRVSWR